ncbi:MAG: peptidylprolyl isomerase [Clostridium sp.]
MLTVLAVGITSLALVGCAKDSKTDKVDNSDEVVTEKSEEDTGVTDENLPVATIVIKGMGTIKAELFPEIAPNTVNNFIELANDGFYDGVTFHRIIKGFMNQGGDPEGTGMGGPGYSIKGEFLNNGFGNNLKHTPGVLSMARSKAFDSAGSQFFIMTGDAPHLDGDYAGFGKVIEGMSVVRKIENTKIGANDKPKEPIVIKSIKVDTKGKTYDKVVKALQ